MNVEQGGFRLDDLIEQLGKLGPLAGMFGDVKKKIEEFQEKLKSTTVEGTSGGGMVRVAMSCDMRLKKLEIDPEVMSEDREMVEDLVKAAVNEGLRRAKQELAQAMGPVNLGPLGEMLGRMGGLRGFGFK